MDHFFWRRIRGHLALKREQLNLRFQAATQQLEKPSRVREVRRGIARIQTEQNARAKAQASNA